MMDLSTSARPGTLPTSLVGVVPSARFGGTGVVGSGIDTWRGQRSAGERTAAAFAGGAPIVADLRNAAGYGSRPRGCPL